jgi:hypothetical protein
MISAIIYVIQNEEPEESPTPTAPPSTQPPSTPPPSSPPSPTSPTTTLPPSTAPPITSPPTQPPATSPETRIGWVKKFIEAEMEEYITDERYGVKVMRVYKPSERESIAVDVLFENRTETPQEFNLKRVCLFFYKSEEEYIKDCVHSMQLVMTSFEMDDPQSVFSTVRELNEHVEEIPPKNGLRVIFHFKILAWQPDFISFETYYYEHLEYTEWQIKVR